MRSAAVTHAAGLSHTGDPALDAALPLPERYDVPADTVADVARKVGIPAQSAESTEMALAAIVRFGLDPPPRILITGSLYLAGEVLKENGTPAS